MDAPIDVREYSDSQVCSLFAKWFDTLTLRLHKKLCRRFIGWRGVTLQM